MVAMKNALLKDTFREIKKTLSRFLSIFAIVALGVSFFAGVKATCPDMKITADKYFDDYHLMDIRLVSTIGFNEEDVKAVKKAAGVEGVMPSYSIDALVKVRNKDLVVKVVSLPMDKVYNPDDSYINRVKLVEGRLPQRADECVTERGKMANPSLSIGSKIKLSSGTDSDIDNSIKNSEFTIVGYVETPYYISYERGTSSIGDGKVNSFIMIPQQNFILPVYTDIFLTVKGSREKMCFDDGYDDIIEPVKDQLEDIGKDRAEIRYNEILSWAKDSLNAQKKEFEYNKASAETGLKDGASTLQDSKAQIEIGQSALFQAQYEYNNSIREAEDSLNEGYKKLEEGEKDYYLQLEAFNEAKEQQLKRIKSQEGISQLEKEGIMSSLSSSEAKLSDAKKQLDELRVQLESQSKILEAKKAQAQAEFSNSQIEINNSWTELYKGSRDLEDKRFEYNMNIPEAQRKIDAAEEQINEIDEPEWYVLDRDTNPGFVDYGNAADRMDAIAEVFPVFFFLVAALVCLTTMTRMVDEQRINIGTLKALGYSKASIASKYLLYAAFASISGSIFGLLVGFRLFPTVITNAYGIMYTVPDVIIDFNTQYALISTASTVLTNILAAWFACYHEFSMTPALLMRPKAPKAGKRILLERIKFIWSGLNFTQKITARNLLRYKKRFLMTVLGIGGCTALLLVGFGLRDSITSIVTKQFEEIYKYDMIIELKKEVLPEESPEIIRDISRDSRISQYMLTKQQNVDVSSGDITKTVTLYIPESTKRLENFILFRIRTTGKNVPLTDKGVVITEKLSKMLNVKIGDDIKIKNNDDDDEKEVTAKITGITENYVSHYVYMSPDLYKSLYGEKVKFKQIVAKTISSSEDFENKLSTDLLKKSNVSSISFTTGISSTFKDIIGSLNYVVLVLIVSAGALAFVVLYNLTNINVTERLREIATIKVLGFYNREVSAYVYRENIFLTLFGIMLGLVLGIFLHRFIIVTTEVEYVMFGRNIMPLSFIYSAILTAAFSGLVNLVMYYRLKTISMVESMKSVD